MLWRCGGGLAAAHGGHGAHGSRATVSGATHSTSSSRAQLFRPQVILRFLHRPQVILRYDDCLTFLPQPSSGGLTQVRGGENPCLKVLITWNQAGLRVVTATTEHALRSAGLGYRSRANSLSFQYALFTKFSWLLAILFTFLSPGAAAEVGSAAAPTRPAIQLAAMR